MALNFRIFVQRIHRAALTPKFLTSIPARRTTGFFANVAFCCLPNPVQTDHLLFQESYLTWCSPIPFRELGTASIVLTVISKTVDFSYVHMCVCVWICTCECRIQKIGSLELKLQVMMCKLPDVGAGNRSRVLGKSCTAASQPPRHLSNCALIITFPFEGIVADLPEAATLLDLIRCDRPIKSPT